MSIISNIGQQNNTINVDGSQARDVRVVENRTPELKNGQTIQGTVVSVTDTDGGKVANINIGDTVISAKLQDGMGLREGQTLNFAVKGQGGGTVNITPLYENTSADQSTLKALTAAGIEITNDTVQMVRDMMEAGLSIGKEALLEMNRNLSMHPNTSISTMVEMKSLNIPVNDNNITQFESYKNYEHQVTSEMESIMNELPNAFSELVSSGNTAGALNLYGSVLKLFGGEEAAAAPKSGEMAATALETEAAAGITQNTENISNAPNAANIINTADTAAKEGASLEALTSGAEAAKTDVTKELLGEEGKVSEQNATTDQKAVATSEEAKAMPNSADDTALLIKGADKEVSQTSAGQASQTAAQGKNILSDGFVDSLKNLGISDETIDKYQAALRDVKNLPAGDQSNTPEAAKLEVAQKELLKELAKSFENADLSNVAERTSWKNVFSSSDYNKLLKANISSQWTLKPLEVQDKENVEHLYQRLGNQVKGLTNAISQNLGAESKLFQSANNLQNNLDFMNQLNQMFQYVQLPLQMAGQNTHGDLYVYRNKHKKMSEDGSVSAVLHLDMDNLGPLDVYVKMKDTKVTTNFYVADDKILDLINDNIHILNERLEKRGYTMSVKLSFHDDMDSQDAAVDEMLDVTKTPILSVNSFDARA